MFSTFLGHVLCFIDFVLLMSMELLRAISWYQTKLFDSAHVAGYNLTDLLLGQCYGFDVKKRSFLSTASVSNSSDPNVTFIITDCLE